MTGRGGRPRRAVTVAIVLMVLATAVAATVAAAGTGLFDGADGARTPGRLPPKTAQVTRQTLVDTQSLDGEVGYGDTTVMRCRLAGTLTSLPMVDSTIQRGQTMYKIDNSSIILLYGSLPSYRTLAAGVEGSDVKQFEQNLYRLGYRGFTVDKNYTASTASAVEDWQEDIGLTGTGTVELGRVVYARSAVRVASHQASLGDALQPGAEVLGYSGTTRLISIETDMSDQRLAKKAAAVTVTLPAGKTTTGKVASVATVIDISDSGTGAGDAIETKLDVIVAVDDQRALAGLDHVAVDVSFTVSKRENVLTVPVAALLALAEGGYGLQLVEGGSTRVVAVRTGMFTSGRVEVSGAGLSEGARVGIPA